MEDAGLPGPHGGSHLTGLVLRAGVVDERVSDPIMDRAGLVEHLTDLGNAKRLVRLYGERLRYVPDWRTWLIWKGKRWERDRTGDVERMAKDVLRRMHDDVGPLGDRGAAERLSRHAFKSESEAKINAMIGLARSEPSIPIVPEQLDADPWALNCQNGTVDLRTGELRSHDPGDLITKISPVPYQRDAEAPRFLAFLDRVMGGDPDLIAFIGRAVGYSLTGVVNEHVLFICHGIGANGKSTFLGLVQDSIGDYSQQGEPGLLLQRPYEAHPTGLAKLKGARLVAFGEIDPGPLRRFRDVFGSRARPPDKKSPGQVAPRPRLKTHTNRSGDLNFPRGGAWRLCLR